MDQNPNQTDPDEFLPLAEAAQRIGIAYDTARKRLKAGTLQGERRDGRWYVSVPAPEIRPEQHSGDRPEDSGPIPDDTGKNSDTLVAALQDEIAFLRQQLDHQTHIIAGLVSRLPDLPALAEPANAPVDAPGPLGRADPHEMTANTSHRAYGESVPSQVSLLTAWRLWWRRVRDG